MNSLASGALCKAQEKGTTRNQGTSYKRKAIILGREDDSGFNLQYWLWTWRRLERLKRQNQRYW